jgi:uncharacterized protein
MLRYDKMVEQALRGVVRDALTVTAANGLPGVHHFYITFRTAAPGVAIPPYLLAQYPEEITIVLEHQFWDLQVKDQCFSVTLLFKNKPERLTVPWDAITAFADPAVKFGLQFQTAASDAAASPEPNSPAAASADPKPAPVEKADSKTGEVVTLDSFRKK